MVSEFTVELCYMRSEMPETLQMVWSQSSGTSRYRKFICRVGAPRKQLYANEQEKEQESMVEAMAISFTFRYLPFCVSSNIMHYNLIRMICVSVLMYGSLSTLSL